MPKDLEESHPPVLHIIDIQTTVPDVDPAVAYELTPAPLGWEPLENTVVDN